MFAELGCIALVVGYFGGCALRATWRVWRDKVSTENEIRSSIAKRKESGQLGKKLI